jgi:hypothetical protein
MDRVDTDRRELLESLLRKTSAADHLARQRYVEESLALYEDVAARLSSLSDRAEEAVRRSSVPPPAAPGVSTVQARVAALRAGIAAGLRAEWGILADEWELVATRVRRAALCIAVLVLVVQSAFAGPRWALRDLTENARWAASSQLPPASGAGVFARFSAFDDVPNYFFHTKLELRPHLDIDLGVVRWLDSAVITNRVDCCTERSRDLEIWLGDDGKKFHRVLRRAHDDEGRIWTAELHGQRARFVRLEVPRKDYLHLARVRVFGR